MLMLAAPESSPLVNFVNRHQVYIDLKAVLFLVSKNKALERKKKTTDIYGGLEVLIYGV